ncbi:PSP1 domain-containing protein [Blastopirellula sp. J2-11]|uniref:PSP1 domain-containing protein n=1 Tax=Blastopirellula sp. J2-11 TaxID=2943192 RepID=UPI0021C8B02A|nr:PSP1 domain-containing protein [Blastopirellula sp. J2-11]UUO08778.1 PSP1 domain-containing protein [Blastopirellula sp. J2-11]
MISTIQRTHLVRVGAVGQIGRFVSVDAVAYRRGMRVVCRTARGLEVGEILSPANDRGQDTDGSILRGMTQQDEMLLERLEKNKQEAMSACTAQLAQRNLDATLIDVEQLFDGQSLFFYFLGEVSPEIERLTEGLAETYDAKVRIREFAKLLDEGCGPGCGTDEGPGCGSSCSTCSLVGGCGVKKTKG